MRWSEYVRRARVAVAASDALQEHGEREMDRHRAAHGCRRWLSWCELDESPEYHRLNSAAGEAIDALPFGTRSVAALDLFATVDGMLSARRRRNPQT